MFSRKYLLPVLICLLSGKSFSIPVKDTLYINRGTDTLYGQAYISCAFNRTPVYSGANTAFKTNVNDTLQLVIINTDTFTHTLTIDAILTSGNIVAALDTITVQFAIAQNGTYRYYSALSNGGASGASGVITVGYTSMKRYEWNIFDRDTTFANKFHAQSASSIDTSYHPAFFTINGKTYPASETDTTITISAMVGDSIIISIVNSGHMYHSMHFHGFHGKILTSNYTPYMINWTKDSFPMAPGATITFLVVPDKPGMYPMHDHNLIVSTNAGLYPGGMMGMFDIMP